MRLTRKLTFALAGAILLVLGVNAAIRIQVELTVYEIDVQRDSRVLGRAVAGAVSLIWQQVGESEAMDLVADANQRESNVAIRWVWLDAAPGTPSAPTPPADLRRLAPSTDGISALRWRAPEEESDALYTYVGVAAPNGRPGAIELRETLDAEDAFVRRTVLQSTLGMAILVLLCAMIALGLGSVLVGRPVRKLVAQARRIGEGDLTTRLDLPQRDEIGELALEMNAMQASLIQARAAVERESEARVAAVGQLRHADRLTTVGKLAAGIAHEVGTPLNVIIGYAQLIVDEVPTDSPVREHASVVASQAHRVASIIRELLDFARPRPPRKASHELTAIARQVVALLQSLAQKRQVRLRLLEPELAASASVRSEVDANQLQQVLTNLVVNAVHASAVHGEVRIAVSVASAAPPADHGAPEGCWACIAVSDDGPGIEPEALPRIFEPFFTTKEPGEGTGLGLSVAYGIVKEHGGWIAVQTELGQGTCFSVYLPLEPSEST